MKSVLQLGMVVALAAAAVPALCGQRVEATSTANNEGVSDPIAVAAPMALLKCAGADGASTCTSEQVADLNREIVAGRKQHKQLTVVQDLDLERHGWLKCSQMDGSACTDDQLTAVIAVAGEPQNRGNGLRLAKQVEMAER